MALSNVSSYLAECLDVPVTAIDLKLKYPHPEGTLETFNPKEMNEHVLSELRLLWK